MDKQRLMRISEADLRFLVQTVATARSDHEHVMNVVRDKPDILDRMLDDDTLFRRIVADEEALVRISPWLLFTILLRRAAKELPQQRFTMERVGSAERVPVFDVDRVGELLQDRPLLDYLAEMLASFVRTDSAVVYYKSGRRYRRRTFSDLDVDDMIALAGTVAEESRFPFYRRIGDICLFIAGVFPEFATSGTSLVGTTGSVPRWRRNQRGLAEYEAEAARFYGLAAHHPAAYQAGLEPVLATLSTRFTLARKPLNYIADHFIRLHRSRLFGLGA
jgi:hypothetical protein